MSEPAARQLLTVGRINGCFGIQGWVKIHSYTEPVENFFGFESWLVRRHGSLEPIEFDAGRRHGKGLVAHIAGVDDRTLAETFKGLEVVVPSSALPPLEEGDYYWHQLQGLQVWCSEAGSEPVLVGEVDHLIETGANDVLVVRACTGSIDERERLVPYLPGDVVTGVDLERGRIEVDWFLDE